MSDIILTLSLLPERCAVCQLEPGAGIPGWALNADFFAVTHTPDELSIVCPEASLPAASSVTCELGWRVFRLEGPFEFTLTGILLSVLDPLAGAGVGIFAFSTYDTDYVLVKENRLEQAIVALSARGHTIRRQS